MENGDECPECRGIDTNPDHYRGKPVTDARVLRCVLYEAFTLAITVQTLGVNSWSDELCYKLPVDSFDPQDVLKFAALTKIRLLFDFLYNEDSTDDFRIVRNFQRYGFDQPLPTPALVGLQGRNKFNKKSINKFVVHLTKARITKPKCIPEPRFKRGLQATLDIAKLILKDVESFASTVVRHDDFPGLENWGRSYHEGLRLALVRMNPE